MFRSPISRNMKVVEIALIITMYIPVEEAISGCFPIEMRSGL